MQLLRLFYIPIGALIFNKQYKYQDKREAINSISVYGIWLGIITVIAFLEQGTIMIPFKLCGLMVSKCVAQEVYLANHLIWVLLR